MMHWHYLRRARPLVVAAAVVLAVALAGSTALAAGTDLGCLQLTKSGGHGRGHGHAHGGPPVFSDVAASHWAWANICTMGAKGVLQGYGYGLFGPQKHVTRLELVVMATRLLGFEDEALEQEPADVAAALRAAFRDVRSIPSWSGARECLAYALREEYLWPLMQGRSDKTFRANAPATRLEVIVVLLEAMGLGDEAEDLDGAPLRFADAKSVPAWAWGYVALAVEKGILRGDGGKLQLNRPVTRAEMAALLDRADEDADTDLDRGIICGTVTDVDIASGTGTSTITIIPGDKGDDEDEDEDEDEDADEETYDLAAGVVVMMDDRQVELEDVQEGDYVALYFNDEGKVLLIDIEEEDEDEDEETVVEGTVTHVHLGTGHGHLAGARISLIPDEPGADEGDEETYDISLDVEITVNGEAADLTEVEPGDEVKLTLDADEEVIQLEAEYETAEATGIVTGLVRDADGDLLALTLVSDGRATTYQVATDVEIYYEDEEVDASEVETGDTVKVEVARGRVTVITITHKG